MPSTSKAQQQVMGMALAARRGEINPKDLTGAALEIYKSDMSTKDIEDFAKTKHKSLKEHLQESLA